MTAADVRSGWVQDLHCRQRHMNVCLGNWMDFLEVEKAVGRAGLRDSSGFQF